MNRPTYFEAVGALTELPAGHWQQLAASGREVVPRAEGVSAYSQGAWSSDIKYVVASAREAFEVLETRGLLPEGWSWDEERLFSRMPRDATVEYVDEMQQMYTWVDIPMASANRRRVVLRSLRGSLVNDAEELLVDVAYASVRAQVQRDYATGATEIRVARPRASEASAGADPTPVGAPLAPPAPFPPDIASCVLFGADPHGVATAEAMAREIERAQHPPADRRIVWRIIDRKIVQEQPACALLDTGYQLGAVTPEALVLWMPW